LSVAALIMASLTMGLLVGVPYAMQT